ncbi:hypothetical protein [Siphonobacter sp. SORGH_AS_0500]|uniref:hypothetical protein n=1 Tax=Siphonobacter sp. SORGH_AS_0500 TaxID=1864824 RepID=UPI00285E371A|nr:hypothetical protein [Siphonobacter sp. SORGH_AS_0500]MDR6195644.1 hypothetical protein [Siphonobacter sp. SORGH_AS_0500]
MTKTEQTIKKKTGKNLVTDEQVNNWDTKNLAETPVGSWNPSTNTPELSTLLQAIGEYVDMAAEGKSSIPTGVQEDYFFGDQVIKTKTGIKHRKKASVPSSNTVDYDKFSISVLTKNLPFHPTSNPNSILKASIKNIRLFGADPNKQYVLTTLRRNVTISGTSGYWQFFVFEWNPSTNALGAAFLQWTSMNYVPSNTIEAIEYAVGNKGFQIIVDWSAVPDNTNLQSLNFNQSGIGLLAFQALNGSFFANNSIPAAKISDEIAYKNYPWGTDVSPSSVYRSAIKKVTVVGFPDTSKQLTLSVVRRNITLNGVAGTWEITLHEWVNGAFGNAVYRFSAVNYVPSKTVETITLQGISGATGSNTLGTTTTMIVDWSAVPDNYNGQGVTYANGGLSYLVHTTKQAADIADASLARVKLGSDIPTKNYPFDATATVPALFQAAIKNIQIVGTIDQTKKLSLTILRRNVTISGTTGVWQVSAYDVTNGFGATIYSFNRTNYLPTASVETIELTGAGFAAGTSMYITIDWDQVPDGTDRNSLNFAQTGISPLVMRSGKAAIGDLDVTIPKIANEVKLKNYPFHPTATPSTAVRAGILDAKIVGSTVDPTKNLTVGVIRKNALLGSTPGYWQIIVFDHTEGVFTSYYQFSQLNYVPTRTVEWITLTSTHPSTAGTTMFILVNWDAFVSGTNASSIPYSSAGLAASIFYPVVQQAQQYDIILPPKIYMFPGGMQYWFYDDTIVYNHHIFEKRPVRLSLESRKISDNTLIAPVYYPNPSTLSDSQAPYMLMQGMGKLTGYTVDHNLTVKIDDYSRVDAINTTPATLFSKTFQVIHKVKPAARPVDVIMIGDSYINNSAEANGGVYYFMDQFAQADGFTLNFKGTRNQYTRGNKTYVGEGRGSWAEPRFLTYVPVSAGREPVNGDPTKANMTSPFMFSADDTVANAKFDFGQYRSVNNIGNVDLIYIFLGMNGGNGNQINQTMIPGIKADVPDAKIVITTVPGAERMRLNFDSTTRQLGRLNQNKSYINLFAGREAEGIYLCPVHMNFHRVYSLRNAGQEQIQFNMNSVPQIPVNIDHHANLSGDKGIAYMMYQYGLVSLA